MQQSVNLSKARDMALAESNDRFNVHDQFKGLSVEQLQAISQDDRRPWHTACLNVTGDLNVGTMIRTSHCLGAKSVTILGRQKIDNRSLVGSANYIKVEKVSMADPTSGDDARKFFWSLVLKNMTPIFVESNGLSLTEVNWPIRIDAMNRRGCEPCLVMGNETGGIPDDLIRACLPIPNCCVVSIPQRGVIRSLNVAVAHSIVASHMCMQMGWMA